MPAARKTSGAGRVEHKGLAAGSGVVAFPSKPRVPLGQAVPETAGGVTPSFSDHGGPIIPHVRLILVFWGSSWNTTSAVPSVGQMTDAVVNILTGPYMSSLSQYRGIGSGYLQASIVVAEAVGSSPATPPKRLPEQFRPDVVRIRQCGAQSRLHDNEGRDGGPVSLRQAKSAGDGQRGQRCHGGSGLMDECPPV